MREVKTSNILCREQRNLTKSFDHRKYLRFFYIKKLYLENESDKIFNHKIRNLSCLTMTRGEYIRLQFKFFIKGDIKNVSFVKILHNI